LSMDGRRLRPWSSRRVRHGPRLRPTGELPKPALGFAWRWFWKIVFWGVIALLGLWALAALVEWAGANPDKWTIAFFGALAGLALYRLEESESSWLAWSTSMPNSSDAPRCRRDVIMTPTESPAGRGTLPWRGALAPASHGPHCSAPPHPMAAAWTPTAANQPEDRRLPLPSGLSAAASSGPDRRPQDGRGREVHYANCAAARAAGAAPVRRGDPGYGRHLDRDGDGKMRVKVTELLLGAAIVSSARPAKRAIAAEWWFIASSSWSRWRFASYGRLPTLEALQ